MTIARSAANAYVVLLFDDLASVCGTGSLTGRGTATGSPESLAGTTTLTCATGQVLEDAPFRLTYRSKTNTLVDGLGVVWSRARSAQQSRGTLPLGRLVLASDEAPGLKPRAAKPGSAKPALARALRPRRLPGFAPSQTQVSHFRRGTTDLWSLAFVMKNGATAKAAATAIAKGRATRVSLGSGGHVLRRARTTAVWHRGRVLGAIVLTMRHKAAIRAAIAVRSARVADGRVARALSRTALDRVLEGVTAKGELPRKTALDLFALAFAPLPGTKRPPGPAAPIADGTMAVRNILRLWRTLTPAQRVAAARLIGIAGVQLPSLRWTASRKRTADYGDPNFTPDAGMTQTAQQYAAIYVQKTGFQFKLPILVGPGSQDEEAAAAANATPVDDQGNLTEQPTLCKVTVTPAGMAESAENFERIIAHEAFHCVQFAMTGVSSWLAGKFGDWVGQGTADWAAFKVTGVPWKYAYSFQEYLETCFSRSLYSRVDNSAVGFFGHSDDFVGDFWKRIEPTVVDGFKKGSDAAYDAARGNEPVFLDTWASSAFILGKRFGLAWTSSSPVQPPNQSGCGAFEIFGDDDVKSIPKAIRLYVVDTLLFLSRPLMHVQIKHGHARISDGKFVDQNVTDAWFCVGGVCECPAGTEGTPPAAPTLFLPAIFGITGGKGPGEGTVTFVSLEDFCKHKQPLPPVEGPGRQGEKPPDPVECTPNGCGQSAADPHLRPFGGNWYDFQAVGEFTLLRSTSGELEVQVRQQPWPGSKLMAINTAVAMRVAGDRVTIYKGQPLVVRVNGRPVLLRRTDVRLPKGGVLRPLRRGQLDVVWPDGTVVRVYPLTVAVDLIVSLAPKWKGKVTGLLGDNNGNRADDFKTRADRVLDPNLIRGKDERAYRLRYRVYGNSWRVTPRSSLFDYAPGQSTRTFTNRRFPARIATPEALPAPVKRNAERVCRRMGLARKAILDACILDVGQTRDYGFSTALALAQLGAKAPKGASKPSPPPSPPVTQPPAPPPPGGGLRATITFQGRTLTIRGGPTDEGCRTDRPGVAFSVGVGAFDRDDNRPSLRVSVVNGKRDGRYTTGTFVEIEWKFGNAWLITNSGESPTVTLAGNRTRGTFKGTTGPPRVDAPFSGSFRCR